MEEECDRPSLVKGGFPCTSLAVAGLVLFAVLSHVQNCIVLAAICSHKATALSIGPAFRVQHKFAIRRSPSWSEPPTKGMWESRGYPRRAFHTQGTSFQASFLSIPDPGAFNFLSLGTVAANRHMF